jgi:hypothetical protein
MINKTPKHSKPDFHFNYSKGVRNTYAEFRSSINKAQIKNVLNQSKNILKSECDVDDLISNIEMLVETIRDLDDELDTLQQHAENLESWGEEWDSLAHEIDGYSVYPFVHNPSNTQSNRYIVKFDQITTHDLCSYSKCQDLFNDTGMCYAGYDHSLGVVFEIVDEKRWLLAKLKNGY